MQCYSFTAQSQQHNLIKIPFIEGLVGIFESKYEQSNFFVNVQF